MADPSESTARTTRRRTDTSDPHVSRTRALKILFQADVRGVPVGETLQRLSADPSARAILDDPDAEELGQERELLGPASNARRGSSADDAGPARRTPARREAAAGQVPAVDGFTTSLVNGVAQHLDEVDQLIGRYARRWQISRMPVVDRTVLRLATYELLYESTPPAVVIDEAVTLARILSTHDSGRYVNGVLESIRKDVDARGQGSSGSSPA